MLTAPQLGTEQESTHLMIGGVDEGRNPNWQLPHAKMESQNSHHIKNTVCRKNNCEWSEAKVGTIIELPVQ